MEEFIYLEVDEEITSIIDRMHQNKTDRFGLVVPRGATVLQSVVNLKLIKKEAEKLDKAIAIITLDKIGRNLAAQVGLPVYDDIKQAAVTVAHGKEQKISHANDVIEIDMSQPEAAGEVPEGVNVHYYDQEGTVAPGEEKPDKNSQEEEGKEEKEKDEAKSAPPAKEPDFKAKEIKSSPMKTMQQIAQASQPAKFAKKKGLKRKIIFALAAAALAAIVYWVVGARAQVTIGVDAEPYEAKAPVSIDATLLGNDTENSKVAGTLLETTVDVKETLKASGKKQVGEKAKGTLTFYNNDGIDQTLASGTTVINSGLKFNLTSALTVPKAVVSGGAIVQGKADGEVVAQESGAQFNLPSSTTYTVGKALISAQGGTAGGTTKEVTVVAATDVSEGKDKIIAARSAELRDALKASAKGLFIIEGAVNYSFTEFTPSKEVGAEAENFEAKGKIKAQIIAFDESNLRVVVADKAKKDLPPDKSLLIDEKDVITPTLTSVDLAKKEMKLQVVLSSHVGAAVNTDGLDRKIKGKSAKKARTLIEEQTGAKNIDIKIRPNLGLLRLPFLASSIKFKLDYVNAAPEANPT